MIENICRKSNLNSKKYFEQWGSHFGYLIINYYILQIKMNKVEPLLKLIISHPLLRGDLFLPWEFTIFDCKMYYSDSIDDFISFLFSGSWICCCPWKFQNKYSKRTYPGNEIIILTRHFAVFHLVITYICIVFDQVRFFVFVSFFATKIISLFKQRFFFAF